MQQSKDGVKTVQNAPIFKRTTFSTLPNIVQASLLNELGQKISEGLKNGETLGSLRVSLLKAFQEGQLDTMDVNKHYYLGAHAGEPSDTQNNFWNPKVGALSIKEQAGLALDSKGAIDPEAAQIIILLMRGILSIIYNLNKNDFFKLRYC